MVTTSLGTVAASDQQRAIAPLVLAFSNDPFLRWMYPEPEQYLTYAPRLAVFLGGRAFDCGTAYATHDFAATSLWLPPGVGPAEEALVDLLQRSMPAERQTALLEILTRLNEHHPHEPHWYLPIIGVDPRVQGRGYGSALLERALARCDEDHAPAYLESSNERNIALYERFGFEVRAEIQAGDSPPVWPMTRSAR